ncbi:Chloroperoxidase [Hypoxylon argillaceum]|nr:Chloroperoxidase [Hypoxylon argillaceum]
MRLATTIIGAIAGASAFPTVENLARLAQRDESLPFLTERSIDELRERLVQLKGQKLPFDPLTTPIDVSGEHAFKAPDFANGDQRGPCPGLNALANHGYIPHNGVVSLVDAIVQSSIVLGMGIDIAGMLSALATVFTGNPLSLSPGFSIGGPTPESSNILGNLFGVLGPPKGLYGSHNTVEVDGSLTRSDFYVTGNMHSLNMTLFEKLAEPAEDGFITLDHMITRAGERFYESVATNPYFWYGPVLGTVGRNAAYAFVTRLYSNHTKEYPLGDHLSKEVLYSFYGVYEENGKPVYKEGHERIPENWYRIAVDYNFVSLSLDIVSFVRRYPILLSIGGNVGKVNTFTGLDAADITGGVLNSTNLLEGNNLVCFSLTVLKAFTPNSLSTTVKTVEPVLELLNDVLLDPLLDLDCPAFKDITLGGEDLWTALLDRYPGAQRSGMAF